MRGPSRNDGPRPRTRGSAAPVGAALALAGALAAGCGPGAPPRPDGTGEAAEAPDRAASPWARAARRGVDFRAVGNEPGWHLEVFRGDSVVLVTDYGRERAVFPWTEPEPQVEVEGTVMRTRAGARELVVARREVPCEDTMSGERFGTDVTLRLDGEVLRGCGRSLP